MFGLTIISKKELSELRKNQEAVRRVHECHRWFAGWRDLDIIWGYIFGIYPDDPLERMWATVQSTRRSYAAARGTDVYGKPVTTEVEK